MMMIMGVRYDDDDDDDDIILKTSVDVKVFHFKKTSVDVTSFSFYKNFCRCKKFFILITSVNVRRFPS